MELGGCSQRIENTDNSWAELWIEGQRRLVSSQDLVAIRFQLWDLSGDCLDTSSEATHCQPVDIDVGLSWIVSVEEKVHHVADFLVDLVLLLPIERILNSLSCWHYWLSVVLFVPSWCVLWEFNTRWMKAHANMHSVTLHVTVGLFIVKVSSIWYTAIVSTVWAGYILFWLSWANYSRKK